MSKKIKSKKNNKKKKINKDEKDICILCLDNDATFYSVKCLHKLFCHDCVINNLSKIENDIRQCPICKTDVLQINGIEEVKQEIIKKKFPDTLMHFGKYKDLSFRQILKKDKKKGYKYLIWISKMWKKQYQQSLLLDEYLKTNPIYNINDLDLECAFELYPSLTR